MCFKFPHLSLRTPYALPNLLKILPPTQFSIWPGLTLLCILIVSPTVLAQTVSAPIFVQALPGTSSGNVIAYHPGDGMIYRAYESSPRFFDKINPLTNVVTPITSVAGTDITSMVWYPPLNVFLATDSSGNVFHVTPTGTFTNVGNNGIRLRGLALLSEMAKVF
jgi:hypothetical protein